MEQNKSTKGPKQSIFDYLIDSTFQITMPSTTAVVKKTSPQRAIEMLNSGEKSLYAAKQSRFTTSKLIQNLGSGNNGVQFFFSGNLRTTHGRD